MARRILHIDLDAFYVSVEQASNPDLRGKPVVVGGNPDGRGVVASASYEARSYGVRSAMPLKTARRLCPQTIFLRADFPRYRQASQKFMNILAELTPEIEPVGLDEAYLDITGLTQETPTQTGLHLKEHIKRELGFTASVGIGTGKIVAKIASSRCKPDGLLEIAPGEEKRFLAPLPVSQLPGVGRKTEQVLAGMGITTIGQLAKTPSTLLRQTFGVVGESLYRRANGIDEGRVEIPTPAISFSREITFDQDTLENSFLETVLHRISEQLGAELRQQERQARCITLKIRYADFKTVTRSRTVRKAVNTDQAIYQIGHQLLERALAERHELVRLLGLRVSNLTRDEQQLSLLDFEAERQARLNRAIDHVHRKYGSDSLYHGWALSLKEDRTRRKS